MDEFTGRLLAERYRLPLPPAEEYELRESRAYDTASGQEVLVRQVPLPEVVDAELLDGSGGGGGPSPGRATRTPTDPAVRRAVEAAISAARIPDHPRLDQVFDVFVEDDGLWIVSELVAARPLAAVLAEQPMTPHRAAEIAADLLAALSAVHTYGWTHRNITARTVLICEDGRALLTGLASGAAEEALSGYDPLPTEGPMAPEPLPVGDSDSGGEWAGQALAADEVDEADEWPGREEAVERAASRRGTIDAYRAGAAAARSGLPPGQHKELTVEGEDFNEDPDEGQVTRTDRDVEQPRPERHGPWGGDKPGPPMALPVQLGYRPKQAFVGLDQPAEDELGPLDSADVPYQKAEWTPPEAAYEPELEHQAAPEPVPEPAPEPEPVPEPQPEAGARWGVPVGVDDGRYRGPVSSLAAERARQARMTMVGAVTERWAPEQAGPVYENWRLAPPVGPAADLWALGALLFRAVQGHAPYPEDSVAELVQLVCSEPPAFAEECGPLRPVIESLLRQDPTERPQFEELSGWLRSLIRSAPEPDAGRRVINAQLPPSMGRADPRRLPIIRRRGELVRRRKAGRKPVRAERRKHRRKSAAQTQAPRTSASRMSESRANMPETPVPETSVPERPAAKASASRARTGSGGDPRRLGRFVLGGVLLSVVAVFTVAVLLMPKADSGDVNQRGSVDGGLTEGAGESSSATPGSGDSEDAGGSDDNDNEDADSGKPDSSAPQSSAPGNAPDGYEMRQDPAGFQIAVPEGWSRGQSSDGQVRYREGDLELIVVPGRDDSERFGNDPSDYQLSKQPELADYRASTGWKTSSGVRTITVGDRTMAEGEFGWESGGEQQVLRNRAMLLGGKYHVVLVKGPQSSRAEIDEHFTAVADTYRSGS